MAISIEDIKKLRAMTGAGLADVKKALTEAEGDFDKAKELIRERGLAIAAKRSDRETSNGCVLVKQVDRVLVRRGNPTMDNSTLLGPALTYSLNFKKWSALLSANYEYMSNAIANVFPFQQYSSL